MNAAEQRLRIVRKLKEQIGFLEGSLKQYDLGTEAEAIRIATALRVLFHDTAMSASILTQLGMRECPLLSSLNGDFAKIPHTAFVTFGLDYSSESPVRASPRRSVPYKPVKRNEWWETEVIYYSVARQYTRKDLVKSAANKEGGAHVDPKSDAWYLELEDGLQGITADLSDMTFDGPVPFDKSKPQPTRNLQTAMLRQFGQEVWDSYHHFRWGRP